MFLLLFSLHTRGRRASSSSPRGSRPPPAVPHFLASISTQEGQGLGVGSPCFSSLSNPRRSNQGETLALSRYMQC
jgi:hypothetical protein